MALRLIFHDGTGNAAGPSGSLRGLAAAVGHATAAPPPVAASPAPMSLPTGRVISGGRWTDEALRGELGKVLGPALAPALKPEFEWYLCRGAFFHTDAHFEGVLFGVWGLAGPAVEVVFPRVRVRVDGSPGQVVIFDPFEVHGVLMSGRIDYAAEDYADTEPSVFVGFELALTEAVVRAFRVAPVGSGRTLSSRTRIVAASGAIE